MSRTGRGTPARDAAKGPIARGGAGIRAADRQADRRLWKFLELAGRRNQSPCAGGYLPASGATAPEACPARAFFRMSSS